METYEQRQRRQSDEAVRALREKLMGPRPNITISVFTVDGRSETFEGVQVDTITVRKIGSIGGFRVLSFKTLDFRTVNVLDISYWTVDEK
jgi:hypothetical protein